MSADSSVHLYFHDLFYFWRGPLLFTVVSLIREAACGEYDFLFNLIIFVSFSSSFVCLFPWFWLLSFPQEVCTPALPKQSLISPLSGAFGDQPCFLSPVSVISHCRFIIFPWGSSFHEFTLVFTCSFICLSDGSFYPSNQRFVHVPPCLCMVAGAWFLILWPLYWRAPLSVCCGVRNVLSLCVISTLGAAVFSASSQSERSPTNTNENGNRRRLNI